MTNDQIKNVLKKYTNKYSLSPKTIDLYFYKSIMTDAFLKSMENDPTLSRHSEYDNIWFSIDTLNNRATIQARTKRGACILQSTHDLDRVIHHLDDWAIRFCMKEVPNKITQSIEAKTSKIRIDMFKAYLEEAAIL